MTAFRPQFPAGSGAAEPFSVLTAAGDDPSGPAPDLAGGLATDELLAAAELMLLSRAFDEKGFSLQRQGRFGTFSPVRGQEASVVGAAFAIDPGRDWVVPQYRELPALLRQGLPLENFMLTFLGDPRGGAVPPGVNMLPIQIGLAAQLPHAVGLAWGLRLRGEPGVVLAFCGDGASSEGDFHEAANLAGVLGAPVVFVLQNNGWAISTPRERQSAAATFAARGPGYGMPGSLVDGNDLLAVHQVVATAVARARAGEGPSIVETLTYRLGDHNTADDASRYQPPDELARWRTRDPIDRLLTHLRGRGLWTDEHAERVEVRVRERIDDAVRAVESLDPPGIDAVVAHTLAEPTPRLRHQLAHLRTGGDQ